MFDFRFTYVFFLVSLLYFFPLISAQCSPNNPAGATVCGSNCGYDFYGGGFYKAMCWPYNGETVTYKVYNLPSGATFNSSTGAFYWLATRTGIYSVTFEASDKWGAKSNSETVTITVIQGYTDPYYFRK